MDYDLSQSVSQRGSGEETAENRRILEVADELHRRCQLYEAQLRDSQNDVGRFEVEQRVAEQFAKENGMWIPMSEIFDLGVPGPSGNENDTYVSNDIIYKVNNLLNTGSVLRLLDRLIWHNNLFLRNSLFLEAIDSTGDGKTPETALCVIDVHQEYEYIQRVVRLSVLQLVRQSVADGIDCLELKDYDGHIEKVYFDISRRFEVGY